jgi:hypothetical protein
MYTQVAFTHTLPWCKIEARLPLSLRSTPHVLLIHFWITLTSPCKIRRTYACATPGPVCTVSPYKHSGILYTPGPACILQQWVFVAYLLPVRGVKYIACVSYRGVCVCSFSPPAWTRSSPPSTASQSLRYIYTPPFPVRFAILVPPCKIPCTVCILHQYLTGRVVYIHTPLPVKSTIYT